MAKERYEFDAPTHVFDFNQVQMTKEDDSWFDQQPSAHAQIALTPVAAKKEPHSSADANDMEDAAGTSRATCSTAGETKPGRVAKRKLERSSPPPVKRRKDSSNSASTSGDQQQDEAGNPQVPRPHRKNVVKLKAARTGSPKVSTSSSAGKSKQVAVSKGTRSSSKARVSKTPLNKKVVRAAAAYVPLAQHIMQHENKTPERFRRVKMVSVPSQTKAHCPALTKPHAPKLRTSKRNRVILAKSRAEQEAVELEELQKAKFHAQALNKKILESADSLKKPEVKPPTVQEAFTSHVEKRLQERARASKPQDEEKHSFKALELPKKILEGVVGVPEKKVLQPTVPESPAFLLKKRARIELKVEEVKPPSPIKAAPVPHFGLPFRPLLPESHTTEICPFSFEQRELEKKKLREEKGEKQTEDVPKFKAQLLPNFDTVVLPEKKKMEVTKPEPFKLLVDERGDKSNRQKQLMLEEEQRKLKEAALFKARPSTAMHKVPFQPKKQERVTVTSDGFELATERRARERREFEQLVSDKETLRMHMEEQWRQEKEKQEEEEISRLRQEQVHKAQPIRHYKTVEVKKSEVILTVPKSPNFSDRFRL